MSCLLLSQSFAQFTEKQSLTQFAFHILQRVVSSKYFYMANPANRACLRWEIKNPFLTRRALEAIFYCWEFDAFPMKVVLEPLSRSLNSCEFRLTYGYSQWPPRRDSSTPENVKIVIDPKGGVTRPVILPEYHDYPYSFKMSVLMNPEIEEQNLTITVEFDLPRRWRAKYFFFDSDLISLSEDMKKLINIDENLNHNMQLWTERGGVSYAVHSYFMYWRWYNLFKEHEKRDEKYVIITDISDNILPDIIIYMYCGLMRGFIMQESLTEMCQVIDRYQLSNLYQVFVKNEVRQERITHHGACVKSLLFPLQIARSRRTRNNPSFTFEVDVEQPSRVWEYPHGVTFQMQIRNEAGPWLSYSLRSRSDRTMYVVVNLEVVKKSRGNTVAIHPFVGKDLAVEPEQTEEFENVLFLGCPETFGFQGRCHIRCTVRIWTGRKVEILRSVGDNSYQDQMEGFTALSDDMFDMNKQRKFARMQVKSRPGEQQYVRAMHHELLKVRVPQWWNGFENCREDDMPPDYVTTWLSKEAMPVVLDYIYTGKLPRDSRPVIREIKEYAVRTGFQSLQNLATRYESDMRNLVFLGNNF